MQKQRNMMEGDGIEEEARDDNCKEALGEREAELEREKEEAPETGEVIEKQEFNRSRLQGKNSRSKV